MTKLPNLRKKSIDLSKLKDWLLRLFLTFYVQIKDLPSVANRVPYYSRLWLKMTKNAFMVVLAQKKLFLLFLAGKLLRFVFFSIFLIFLVRGSGGLAGYSVNEALFFFLTFNLVDVTSQFLYREVYRFRPLVVSGDLDLILTKPYNSLFRVLMGGTDIIDLVTIPPLIVAIVYVGQFLDPTVVGIISYVVLVINSLIIATAFHITVLGLGIITFEVDHIIWMYRDVTNLGRFHIDIYRQPLQLILTYLVPVGLMMSVPVRSMLGLVSLWGVVGSVILGIILLRLSLRFWNFSILKYQSASS